MYLSLEQVKPRRVLFVDDNIVNAYNVFCALSASMAAACVVRCYWFEPPLGGRHEQTDDATTAAAHALLAQHATTIIDATATRND